MESDAAGVLAASTTTRIDQLAQLAPGQLASAKKHGTTRALDWQSIGARTADERGREGAPGHRGDDRPAGDGDGGALQEHGGRQWVVVLFGLDDDSENG